MSSSASAVVDPQDGIISIEVEDCTIIVTYASINGGNFILEVWDDGVMIGSDDFTVPPGGTGQGFYTISAAVMQGASGLGIYISQDTLGNWVDWVDPYNGADDILERCRDQATTTTMGDTPITRPPGEITTTTVERPTTTVERPTTTVERPTTTMEPTTTTTARPTTTGGTGSGTARPATPIAGTASYTG
jgi:hypothetical protein